MYVCVWGVGIGVWMGVGGPCPPIRNDIVTPRHLLFFDLTEVTPNTAPAHPHATGVAVYLAWFLLFLANRNLDAWLRIA